MSLRDSRARSASNRSPGGRLWQFTLAALLLAAVARMSQLATRETPNSGTASSATASTSARATDQASGTQGTASTAIDRELAELYATCPMAAVVDFQTVVTSPEQVAASAPLNIHRDESIHLAASESKMPSASGTDWLVDPNEWFTAEEQSRRGSGQQTPSIQQPESAAAVAPVATPPTAPRNRPAQSSPSQPIPFAAPPQLSPVPVTSPATPQISLPSSAPTRTIPPVQAVETPAVSPSQPSIPTRLFDPPTPAPNTTTPAPSFTQQSVPPRATPPANIAPANTQSQSATSPPFPAPPITAAPANISQDGVDPHLALYAKNAYPSARECAVCHEDIYHEWSVSAHAYAAVSPTFHKFEQKLNDLSQGTVGYFCMRCHAPVATSLGASRAEPIWNLPEVAREGVTCIACHRVQYVYGKSNGERRIEEGNIFAPVFGGLGGDGVAETIHRKEHFKVKTSPDEKGPGQEMHVAGIYFDALTKSEFCAPCHQVAVQPGIKLEVVWEQYRASPACKKGIQCQDCHMGREPGLPLGYNIGPVAKVANKTVNDQRKRSNHVFYGPNYSIAHPGVFPFHLKASRWTMEQWLAFDWRAGWGTDQFEDRIADGQVRVAFPACWKEADDRYDARDIIEENLKKLHAKRETRLEIMENGSHVDGPFFDRTPSCGQDVEFHFVITNTNDGHNLLTASLGAQPQFWANIVLIGPAGQPLWETGYTDSYGDLANIHSVDVRNGRLPFDYQLFNLQTMFLITGAKGTDREFFIPVNIDIDQLPFLRPGVQPISVMNHPPFIRMESQSLAPLGSRKVPYRIPGALIRQPGKYRLSFRMRSRAEPPYFLRFCDATLDMQRSMNEWMIDVHPISVEFIVN